MYSSFYLCQVSVCSSVLSHPQQKFGVMDITAPLGCVMALGSWTDCAIALRSQTDHVTALRQISVTAPCYSSILFR